MLLLTSVVIVAADDYPPFDGPNYWGFSSSGGVHKVISVGGTFTTPLWVHVLKSIDTASADNMTFTPGIISYTSTDQGNLFASYLVYLDPEGAGTIDNVIGYAKPITGASTTAVNNTNATLATITWTMTNCGRATLAITEGGTARLGGDVPVTYIPFSIYVHPQAITGFTAVKQGSTQINLAWTKHVGDDKTVIVWNSGHTPTSISDGTILYNNTGSSTSQSGLSPGDIRYYSAWGWNNSGSIYSYTYVSASAQTNRVPAFGVPSPTNGSGSNPRSFSWSISITDPDADSLTWSLQCSNGQQTSGAGGGGTKSLSLGGLAYSTTYKVWANASDATDTTRAWYQFTTLANTAPAQGTPSPANGTTGQPFSFSWTIPLSDLNGDTLTWTIQCNNTQQSSGAGQTNGTKTLTLSGLTKLHWYKIWVNVTDGTVYTRRWYNFETMDNTPPAFGTPTPVNNSVGQSLAFTWQIGMTDADLDSITWTVQCSNGQQSSGSGAGIGLVASLPLSGLSYLTTYKIWVNATDAGSGTYTRRWYQFTTVANQPPNVPTNKAPSDTQENVNPGINLLRLTVSDPEGQAMGVRFYWGNGTYIGTAFPVASGSVAQIVIPDLLENTNYSWYVNITDGYGGYRRGPAAGNWTFATGDFATGGGIVPGGGNVTVQEVPGGGAGFEFPWIYFWVALMVCLLILFLLLRRREQKPWYRK
jgi:hypothetical protein